MKQIIGTRFLLLFTALCAVSGFLMRIAFFNGASAIPQIILSFIAAGVIICVSLLLTKQQNYDAMFQSSVPDFILSVLSCIFFAVGGVLRCLHETGFSRLIGVLAVIAAISLFLSAILRLHGKDPNSFGYVAVLIFFIVKLFFDFRHWMVDPAILDYCYLLFSSISFMLASFYAAAFCYNHGKRRLLTISSLCGVFFGVGCIPDLTVVELVLYVGSILWMLCCAWQATREVKEPIKE